MLAPGRHYVNAPISITANFKDSSGNDLDPTTVTFKTVDPSRLAASYVYGTDDEVVREDAGDYTATVTPDKAGRWFYRWESTGGVIASEGDFLVQLSQFFDDDCVGYQ